MKKKFLVCSLAVAAAVSASAFAGCKLFGGNGGGDDSVVTQDHMRFELKDDGTYELARYDFAGLEDREDENGVIIEGYKGDGETVTVPDSVNGKGVTSVAGYAFADTGVKSVTLPAAVSVLPDRIFDGCTLLETVGFSAVTSVGELAFHLCENLKSIEFQSGLTEIGDRAFESCTALTTATLPDTVKVLGYDCFRECPISSINTAGVETIGKTAFYQCGNITRIDLPNVVSIGEQAFRYCNKLSEITIGTKLQSLPKKPFIDMPLLAKVNISSPVPDEMLMWNETVTEVTLGEGVTAIGESAFAYSKGISGITLPSTVTKIGKSAFGYSALTGTVSIPAAVKTIGDNAFYDCDITGLTLENGVESIGASAFRNTDITSLSLPASVKTVGDNAFGGCNDITQISFGEGLESIGNQAFTILGDEELEIVLPSTVRTLGDGCFGSIAAKKLTVNETVGTVGANILKGCKVRELTVPVSYGHNASAVETLTLFGEGDIPVYAYKNCTALKTVNLGEGVKSIGSNAFKGLEKINLNGVEYLGESALGDISALTYTKTENGVNYIDNWIISSDYSQGGATQIDLSGLTGVYEHAFKKTDTNDTSTLTTVFLTDSDGGSTLKQIGRYAFEGTGITGVEIPVSLKNWNYAFGGCAKLNAVAFAEGVEKIADGAFIKCTNISGFNFANTDITEIGDYAFSDCNELRLITLPNGIKKIGDYAFRNCTSLLTADLKGTEEIGEYAFYYCTSLGSVTMNSVKTIGDSAFSACSELTEIDLTASVTKIDCAALGRAETVNFAGTAEEWSAIDKYMLSGKLAIWSPKYVDGKYLDLTVTFADGSSVTYSKNKS